MLMTLGKDQSLRPLRAFPRNLLAAFIFRVGTNNPGESYAVDSAAGRRGVCLPADADASGAGVAETGAADSGSFDEEE